MGGFYQLYLNNTLVLEGNFSGPTDAKQQYVKTLGWLSRAERRYYMKKLKVIKHNPEGIN